MRKEKGLGTPVSTPRPLVLSHQERTSPNAGRASRATVNNRLSPCGVERQGRGQAARPNLIYDRIWARIHFQSCGNIGGTFRREALERIVRKADAANGRLSP
jgi:hypothetical protein